MQNSSKCHGHSGNVLGRLVVSRPREHVKPGHVLALAFFCKYVCKLSSYCITKSLINHCFKTYNFLCSLSSIDFFGQSHGIASGLRRGLGRVPRRARGRHGVRGVGL